jgi:hypothetical protein
VLCDGLELQKYKILSLEKKLINKPISHVGTAFRFATLSFCIICDGFAAKYPETYAIFAVGAPLVQFVIAVETG